ncbi:hypothetical protein AB3S75_040277 [Citrus x aurantiifolia]
MMEWSTLELKVNSCSDLKAFNLFNKLSVYSVVSIINGELKKKEQRQTCLQRQKTPTDREGGGNPEWNHMMKFDIKAFVDNCNHLFIAFDLYSEGVIYGYRSIGKVHVPLKDLIDEFNGAVRFVRYQIRTGHGKPNGVLSFCYKLKGMTIKKGEIPSPEVCLSPGIHSSKEKVNYPSIEVDDLSSPGICYPPLDYVCSPLPGFYSPPPNYQYEATKGYGTTLPPLSPVQVSSLMVASGSHYHPCPSPYVKSPWPWQHVQSTGYANAHDLSVHPVSDGSEHSSLWTPSSTR